jgi:uncharacterized protein YozE (UPF0346 family)
MDAEYLKANVGDILAAGLTAVVLNQPDDTVGYLGKWLLTYVDNYKAETVAQEEAEKRLVLDKAEEEAVRELAAASTKAKVEAEAADSSRRKAFEDFLNTASSTDGLFEGYLQHLKGITGASSCYIGLKEAGGEAPPPTEEEGEAEEGEEGAASTDQIKYVAATEDNAWLLGEALAGHEGVTHSIFVEAPKAEGGEDEEGEEGEEAKPKVQEVPEEDKPLPSVFVPNVLLGATVDKMKFFKFPDLGAYYACRLRYDCCLNSTTLEAALEKQEEIMAQKAAGEDGAGAAEGEEGAPVEEEELEEEEKQAREDAKAAAQEAKEAAEAALAEERAAETEEAREAREKAEQEQQEEANELYLVAHLPKESRDYAVCMDTLGQNRRFSDEEVALAHEFAKLLRSTVLRLDRALFKIDRLKRLSATDEAIEVPSEKERGTALASLKSELEKAGAPATEADLSFKHRQGVINTITATLEHYNRYSGTP